MSLGEDDLRRILKDYFEDINNLDTHEQFAVHMYALGGEPIRRTEVKVRVEKLKSGKAAATRKIIKDGSNIVVVCMWSCVIWILRVVVCLKTGGLL